MTQKKETALLGFVLAILLIGLLMWVGQPTPGVQAQSDLPDRNTPAPSSPSNDDDDDGPIGAHIELYALDAPVGAWSGVQWQNEAGDWYDVEGWQGSLDAGGYRRWWVAAKDFGTGPFRWVVYRASDRSMIAVSQPFHLPAEPNQTTRLEAWVR